MEKLISFSMRKPLQGCPGQSPRMCARRRSNSLPCALEKCVQLSAWSRPGGGNANQAAWEASFNQGSCPPARPGCHRVPALSRGVGAPSRWLQRQWDLGLVAPGGGGRRFLANLGPSGLAWPWSHRVGGFGKGRADADGGRGSGHPRKVRVGAARVGRKGGCRGEARGSQERKGRQGEHGGRWRGNGGQGSGEMERDTERGM